jgi:hypothetical protein
LRRLTVHTLPVPDTEEVKEPSTNSPVNRSDAHAALEVFVGRWRAEGWSYTGTEPGASDPRQSRERWLSTIEARWHTGKFFLLQDERSYSGEDTSGVFETHSVFGVDPHTDEPFVYTFENHGFFRMYKLRRDGNTWAFDGQTERARYEFAEGGRKITIAWELKKGGQWQPLCDRVALKI